MQYNALTLMDFIPIKLIDDWCLTTSSNLKCTYIATKHLIKLSIKLLFVHNTFFPPADRMDENICISTTVWYDLHFGILNNNLYLHIHKQVGRWINMYMEFFMIRFAWMWHFMHALISAHETTQNEWIWRCSQLTFSHS